MRTTKSRTRTSREAHLSPVVMAIALVLVASTASAQRITFQDVMRDTVLENGLHVVVVPNPTVPLVTIQVTVRNGAFTQLTPEEEGVPHILEHMLFRSFGNDGFGPEAYKLQASYNGTTSDETVTYYMTLPSAHLDNGVKLLADLMRAPRFERRDLDAERLVVRGELERSVSNPTYLLAASVDQKLWGEGFPMKNGIGTMVTIAGATPDILKKTYERYYVPNNAAVVFSGDVSAGAAFSSSARHFARWRRGGDPFEGLDIPPMPALTRHEVVTVNAEANDVTLLVSWQGPSVLTDRDATFAADVFSAIVNDRLSPLQTRLVDSGLFQSVSMSHMTRVHTGQISIYATTTPDQVVEASRALREEIGRFSDPDYITAELLGIARKRREVDWAMAMETPLGLASFVGEFWSVADLDYVRTYLDAMHAQTEDDLRRYVAEYLTDKYRVMGILVSPVTRLELGAALGATLVPWRR